MTKRDGDPRTHGSLEPQERNARQMLPGVNQCMDSVVISWNVLSPLKLLPDSLFP